MPGIERAKGTDQQAISKQAQLEQGKLAQKTQGPQKNIPLTKEAKKATAELTREEDDANRAKEKAQRFGQAEDQVFRANR